MQYPNIVYRCPGQHACQGGTYSYKQVLSDEDLQAAIHAGWFKTLPEAMSGTSGKQTASDAPPTRAEAEAKATELGIGFNARTTLETLLERIEAKLK